jgi:hypothetical protein
MSPLPPPAPFDALKTASASAAPASQDAVAAASPEHVDAFSKSLNRAAAALYADPAAIGHGVLSRLSSFTAQESEFRTSLANAIGDSGPKTSSIAAENPTGTAKVTDRDFIEQTAKLQRQSVTVMMQTYSFAVEAQLVTNAATTFTSSINTLIKTQ